MSSPSVCRSESARILLVEGKNDCHVVLALQNHFGLRDRFGIFECGSDEEVLSKLNALIPAPPEKRPEIIGVILDADSGSVDDRWQQFVHKLSKHHYVLPNAPQAEGTIIERHDSLPRIGLWLMPNNREPGNLEDFIIQFVPAAGIEASRGAIRTAQAANVCTFRPVQMSKAVVHTYLAWQDEPGRPLGLSITAAVLRPDCEIARGFANWLARLY